MAFYSDKATVFRASQTSTTAGKGFTRFGRALYELNIESWCANSSQAKGRLERANLTLQDRLVEELRLRGMNTREAANDYAPHFVADYNRRFDKPPKSDFNVHRPLRDDEDLDLILTHRSTRCVSNTLTVKRLGHALRVAQQVQAERDNRRAAGSPSRTNRGEEVRPKVRPTGTRKQRELTVGDVNEIVRRTAAEPAGSVLKSSSR